MFRNKSKILISFLTNAAVGMPWFFLSPILMLYMILLLTNAAPAEEGDIGMGITMNGLFFFCAYLFGKRCLRCLRANKIGKYFENCEDGLVEIEAASTYMKWGKQKFFSVFLDCLGKGYLKNCSVFTEDPNFLLLENGGKSIREKFAILHCRQCGAPGVIRMGFENTCKYCGSKAVWKPDEAQKNSRKVTE